jgi:protease-4
VRALLQVRGLGFAFDQVRDVRQELTFAARAGGPVRAGLALRHLVSERTGDHATDWTLGLLARPNPWLSLGGTLEHPSQPRWDGARMGRVYTAGLGLRPLALARGAAHAWGPRLTLTADLRLREGMSGAGARVRVGAEAEVIPGVALRGAVEDHGGVRLGLGVSAPRATLHVRGDASRAGVPATRALTLAFHAGEERTALAGPPSRRVAVVRAGGRLADESLGGLALLGGGATRGSAALHRTLERAREDPLTRGVLLELDGVRGLAQLEELRPRITRLRAAGKPVVAFLEEGGGRGDLYLAAACDRIVTTEDADFMGLGLRVEKRYWRRLLADLGVRLDRASIGEYKSAYREFSVDSTPPADRAEIERQLDWAQATFVDAVAEGRRIPRERLLPFLDGRRWPARTLAAAGVLDSVGDRADALALLGRLAGLGARPRAVDLDRRPAARRAWDVPARIAIVHASGGIETGASGSDLLNGPFLGARTLVAQIERAFRDRRVGAVVLRIESPGGSLLGSSLIRQALARHRRETGKPLVVSMGGVAASGGYDIALPGDVLFADRATVTGSIGVLYVKPSLEGFYARHRVRQDDFERGDRMRGLSWARDWDAGLQAIADSSVAESYRAFVARVARARGMTVAAVDSAARGRVWFGEEAVRIGLVDRIGGLEDAVAEARRRAGVPEGERIRPLVLGRPRPSLIERALAGPLLSAWARSLALPEWEPVQARAGTWLEP